MLRAILQAMFILIIARLAIWTARLLTGGRRGEEIPPGSAADRAREVGKSGRSTRSGRGRRAPGPRVAPGEIVDVPFTEVPPPESPKRM